jgi:hypothetical protein
MQKLVLSQKCSAPRSRFTTRGDPADVSVQAVEKKPFRTRYTFGRGTARVSIGNHRWPGTDRLRRVRASRETGCGCPE